MNLPTLGTFTGKKEVKRVDVKKAIQSAVTLREAGYKIPDTLFDLLQREKWRAEGVKQLWGCKCPGWNYESPVSVTQIVCPAGHSAVLLWSA